MRLTHTCVAILVCALWGFSFVIIKIGLDDIPPFFLCFLRFFLTCFPIIFFVKKPNVSWRLIITFGLTMFAIKFSLLFIAINTGVSPGLASLLIQLQVFFTILLAIIFLNESINRWQVIGALLSLGGLGVVGFHLNGDIPLIGFILIVLSALAWGIANLISKQVEKINIFPLVVWGSLFALPPLLLSSFIVDGGVAILYNLQHISWVGVIAIIYMAYPVTLFGFSAWSRLLSQYPAGTVAPFGLLIPLFGIFGSVFFLSEPLKLWNLVATTLIMVGLCVNLLGSRSHQ